MIHQTIVPIFLNTLSQIKRYNFTMLSKKICNVCIKKWLSSNGNIKDDEYIWYTNRTLWCRASFGFLNINDPTPMECPYTLEHLMACQDL